MATQKGIQTAGQVGQAKLVSDLPVPKIRDEWIIVKVAAVALNPTDWKHIEIVAEKGAIVGCDYAGTVEEVGTAVTNGLKKGDRVAGWTHGANVLDKETGAFAEHILAKGDLQIKIPENLSFEEASTLGVGITTVGQGLYQSLGLPLPDQPSKEKTPVLIYGASTATGTLAVQYAKLSGFYVITTSSPRNFDFLKSLGADAVFDYNSSTCASDIRNASGNSLRYVFDCISLESSVKISADSIGDKGGIYSSLLNVKDFPREDVKINFTVAYTVFGQPFKFGPDSVPAKDEDFEFGVKFWALTRDLLAEGKIKVHPATVRPGGLGGILDGLQELKEDKVSCTKLVYQIK